MSTAHTATIAGDTITIERPSGRKASRALAIIRALSKASPEVQRTMARFTTDYERDNVVELDRAQARIRFPPRPMIDEAGDPVRDDNGNLVMVPSIIDRMTEEDWERSSHSLRLPKSPGTAELIAAVLDVALETAEDHVYRLLALFTIPNREVKALWRGGTLHDELTARADDLLDDAYADELLELAVVCGEVVDDSFVAKAKDLGGRTGNLLRLIGLEPSTMSRTPTPTAASDPDAETSTDGPSSSTPPSSTDAEPPTDGASTTPSTPPSTSSSNSQSSPTPTPLSERSAA